MKKIILFSLMTLFMFNGCGGGGGGTSPIIVQSDSNKTCPIVVESDCNKTCPVVVESDSNKTCPVVEQNSCHGTGSDSNITGIAQLGYIAGGVVKLYSLNDKYNPISTTTTSESTAQAKAGRFIFEDVEIDSDRYYLLEVSGGRDIDPNDDGYIKTDESIALNGNIYALVRGSALKDTNISINALTDMIYQKLKGSLADLSDSKIDRAILKCADKYLEDVDGDGEVDYYDLFKFDPTKDKTKSKINYQDILESYVSGIHDGISDIDRMKLLMELDKPSIAVEGGTTQNIPFTLNKVSMDNIPAGVEVKWFLDDEEIESIYKNITETGDTKIDAKLYLDSQEIKVLSIEIEATDDSSQTQELVISLSPVESKFATEEFVFKASVSKKLGNEYSLKLLIGTEYGGYGTPSDMKLDENSGDYIIKKILSLPGRQNYMVGLYRGNDALNYESGVFLVRESSTGDNFDYKHKADGLEISWKKAYGVEYDLYFSQEPDSTLIPIKPKSEIYLIDRKDIVNKKIYLTLNADGQSKYEAVEYEWKNEQPVAISKSINVLKDKDKHIFELSGTDADEDPLEYEIVDEPRNGTLDGKDTNRSYTPTPGYTGLDSFTFKIYDGTVYSEPATISIIVGIGNSIVKRTGQIVSYHEDSSIANDDLKDDGFYKKGVEPSYDNESEIVTDAITKLMWDDLEVRKMTVWLTEENFESCKDGNLNDCNNTDGATAATYCSELSLGGYSNWRLPTIMELSNLVDYSRHGPSLPDDVFTYIVSNKYWSSDSYNEEVHYAWSVSFDGGLTSYNQKSSRKYVKCVREGE